MANQDFSLTDQIIWDRLIAIVEDQAQTLVRTAFSTTVRRQAISQPACLTTKDVCLPKQLLGPQGM